MRDCIKLQLSKITLPLPFTANHAVILRAWLGLHGHFTLGPRPICIVISDLDVSKHRTVEETSTANRSARIVLRWN